MKILNRQDQSGSPIHRLDRILNSGGRLLSINFNFFVFLALYLLSHAASAAVRYPSMYKAAATCVVDPSTFTHAWRSFHSRHVGYWGSRRLFLLPRTADAASPVLLPSYSHSRFFQPLTLGDIGKSKALAPQCTFDLSREWQRVKCGGTLMDLTASAGRIRAPSGN